MHEDTYVIVPVYNEATVITEVLDKLFMYFDHVVCVDDGSQDGSAQAIMNTKATLIRHTSNKGQGAALETGIQYALRQHGAKYFVTFDADDQHDAADAVTLVERLKTRPRVDIGLGSRFLGFARGIGSVRKLLLRAAVRFTNVTTGVKLTDTHNGLRAFNRRFARNLHFTFRGMAHASELI
jgi:glycosyltransferase involved in cell wall biosynthesis